MEGLIMNSDWIKQRGTELARALYNMEYGDCLYERQLAAINNFIAVEALEFQLKALNETLKKLIYEVEKGSTRIANQIG